MKSKSNVGKFAVLFTCVAALVALRGAVAFVLFAVSDVALVLAEFFLSF